jgi:S-adenosyl methyltransferase
LVSDYDQGRAIVKRLMAELPSGSYLAMNDGSDFDPTYVQVITQYNARSGAVPYTPRSVAQIAGFFEGLELVEPGVVSVTRWRPEHSPWGDPAEVSGAGGVARKP